MNTVDKLFQILGPVYGARQRILLDSLLSAFAGKIDDAKVAVSNATAQLSITTAWAFWLDQWGELYAVKRSLNESDDSYAIRVITETVRQRPQVDSLESIIKRLFALNAFYVRDMWPFVLRSDQWSTLPGEPLQISDGHLLPDFLQFGPTSATVSVTKDHVPGCFGIWISEISAVIAIYTLEDILANFPLILLSDQAPDSLGLGDGHLTQPGFGMPGDIARVSLNIPKPVRGVPIETILDIINRHRAAGTKPVIVQAELILQ